MCAIAVGNLVTGAVAVGLVKVPSDISRCKSEFIIYAHPICALATLFSYLFTVSLFIVLSILLYALNACQFSPVSKNRVSCVMVEIIIFLLRTLFLSDTFKDTVCVQCMQDVTCNSVRNIPRA